MQRSPHALRDPHAHVIRRPGKRLLHRVPLDFVWNKVTGNRRRSPSAALNLVSFIDFLVVTVIFLLMSFSTSGECQAKAIDIPSAVNVEYTVDAPVVSVEHGQILVDGVDGGSALAIEELGRMERIDRLYQVLRNKRELYTQLQPGKPFPGVCILAIDEDTPAIVVKSVFQTAAFAGYPNISFLTRRLPAKTADFR
jgi:biopolymer transport protein ExbD